MAGETTEARAEKGGHAPLGERLRNKRQALNLTLKEVADGAGLSVGFISQVERGLTAPSLSSLVGIAKTLGSDVTEFLSQPRGDSPSTRHDQRLVYSVGNDAMQYERISAAFPGSILNGVISHEPPGYRSEPIQHEGEEMFFILNGAITVEVENEQTILEAGDTIHFASTRRHSTWNHTTAPATILHVCTLDVFGDHAGDPKVPGNRAGHEEEDGSRPKNNNVNANQSRGESR